MQILEGRGDILDYKSCVPLTEIFPEKKIITIKKTTC